MGVLCDAVFRTITKNHHKRMKISYSWLKKYLNCDLDAEAVAKILTSTGLEVEGAETSESIKGGLKGLVVGEVKTCVPHPDSDHMHVTTVDVGGDALLNIVSRGGV